MRVRSALHANAHCEFVVHRASGLDPDDRGRFRENHRSSEARGLERPRRLYAGVATPPACGFCGGRAGRQGHVCASSRDRACEGESGLGLFCCCATVPFSSAHVACSGSTGSSACFTSLRRLARSISCGSGHLGGLKWVCRHRRFRRSRLTDRRAQKLPPVFIECRLSPPMTFSICKGPALPRICLGRGEIRQSVMFSNRPAGNPDGSFVPCPDRARRRAMKRGGYDMQNIPNALIRLARDPRARRRGHIRANWAGMSVDGCQTAAKPLI